jgi:hypothetical protein
MLRYHHIDLSYDSDPGQFVVFVGGSSVELAKKTVSLVHG